MKKRLMIPLLTVVVIASAGVSYKSDFFEIAKQIEIFTDAFKEINMNYVDEVNPKELMDVAISSMFEHLDPYTNFWNAQDVQQARLLNSGNYTGIGAVIQNESDKIIIKEVFKDLPADKAGLKPGDELIKIGETSVADFEDDAGELLKGAAGTSVELTYRQRNQEKTTTLKRENTKRKLVPFYELFDDDIGYIKLISFGKTASAEIKNALNELKDKGAQKLILDLRGNPGGLLTEAVHTANLFLPKDQLIVSTESVIKKYNRTYTTQREPEDLDIPIAVLIDAQSASASEIVAGSFQDLDRAVVLGGRSFGKGLVQRTEELKYGTHMKMTISRYFTPSGRGIQALDYGHKDEQGRPVRVEPKDYEEFKTKNGRKVFDGGGISPDVKMETSEMTRMTQALLEHNAIFDFAVDFYYEHEFKNPEDFVFTNKDYDAFKNYLKEIDFNYKTRTEEQFEEVYEQSEHENLKKEIEQDYQNLVQKIKQAKAEELNENKAQIEQQLVKEILRNYFYEEGFYAYSLKENPELKKAASLLNDEKQYKKILETP